MREVDKLIGIGILAVLAVQDYRKRKLSLVVLTVLLIAAVCFRAYGGESISGWILSILPGVMFFLISYITREGIGYGDSYVILILGVYFGVWDTVGICFVAVFFMAFLSGIGMMMWNWKKTKRLPFLPFLAAASLGVMIW